MALVLVGMIYDIPDTDATNPTPPKMAEELVTKLLIEEAPEVDNLDGNIRPLKVWVSGEPNHEIRDAHINYLNAKAKYDPEFGFTVVGKRVQNELLERALDELKDGFDAQEVKE